MMPTLAWGCGDDYLGTGTQGCGDDNSTDLDTGLCGRIVLRRLKWMHVRIVCTYLVYKKSNKM
jgi:hypothetical protein